MSKPSKTKSFLRNAGNGFLTVASITADLGTMTTMTEIEQEIDKLQEEYARLNDRLSADRKRPTPYVK
jgi:uncharacterized small protein (DUF1192 family)